MINKLFFYFSLILTLLYPGFVRAQDQSVDYQEFYYKGQVLNVLPKGELHIPFLSDEDDYQTVKIEVLQGQERGKILDLNYVTPMVQGNPQLLKRGDLVVLIKIIYDGQIKYEIIEPYRLSSLFWLSALFIFISILVGGRRGLTSLAGLGITLLILIGFIIPQLVSGQNPFTVSVIGVVVIAASSFYLSHGFKRRTTLALISTLLILLLSVLLAIFAVSFTHLFGMGSEDAASLGIALGKGIDLKGLLLGAIVIGTLGVLDDITTAQVAIVEELKKANRSFQFNQLYQRAMSVGKEHIASLINTLVIAYVGASMPLFLLFSISTRPFWVIVNNEFLAEEIVRTLVGSSTLILSVPLTTAIAAWYYHKHPEKLPKEIELRGCCH